MKSSKYKIILITWLDTLQKNIQGDRMSCAALILYNVLLTQSTYNFLSFVQVNNDRDVVKPQDIPVNCMWCEFAVDTLRKNFLPNVKSEKQLINMTTSLCLEFLKNKTEVKWHIANEGGHDIL